MPPWSFARSAQSRASPRVAAAWSSVLPLPSTQASASSAVGPQFSHRDAAALLRALARAETPCPPFFRAFGREEVWAEVGAPGPSAA